MTVFGLIEQNFTILNSKLLQLKLPLDLALNASPGIALRKTILPSLLDAMHGKNMTEISGNLTCLKKQIFEPIYITYCNFEKI